MKKPKVNFKISNNPVFYEDAVKFMEEMAIKIAEGKQEELIWLTSHEALYTAGVSAKETDLLDKNAKVFKTNRGGKYTYHDDGMRIIYVMLNLKNVFAPEKPDVAKFVKMLENWVINILDRIGIKGEIRENRVGIWVGDDKAQEKKIAAMGIKLKKWVSFHGIAINVRPNLEGFKAIVPCGLGEFGVTSIEDLGKEISFEDLDELIKEEFFKIFKNY